MSNVNNAADKLAGIAQKLPESTQFALINVLPNIPNGAFWGFTQVSEVAKYADALRQDKNIMLRKLNGGEAAIIEVNPDYLVKATKAVSDKLITPKDIASMREGIALGAASLEKFLMSSSDTGFKTTIGIYCINDSSAITYKGTAYKAFRVDFRTAMTLFQKWGYTVGVNKQYVTPQVAQQNGVAAFASMKLSPTLTGVFINVAATYSKEQIKQLKAKYGMTKPTK